MKTVLHNVAQERPTILTPLNGLDLLSALVHELSQPLTVLMGEFELAASCPPDVGESRDLIERSLAEINRVTACMIMFRDLGPVPDPKQVLPVSLDELLKRLCDYLAPAAESQGSRIEFSGLPPLSVRVQGRRLQLIFSRLMQKMLDIGGTASLLKVSLKPQMGMASVVLCVDCVDSESHLSGGVPSAILPDSAREMPIINPKDPDWVLGRWVAESSGGSFEVAITETAAWQVTMTFPLEHRDE